MESSKTISAALKLVDAKKHNLKKAFEQLQSHSSSSSLFPFSWSHIDAHFTSLHTTLSHRFHLLQSLESQHSKVSTFSPSPTDPSPQNDTTTLTKRITALCNNMNAIALREYVGENIKDKAALEVSLQSALKCASDPSSLILDSLDGVFGAKVMKGDDRELRKRKRSCNVLLRHFRALGLFVSFKVRNKAKSVCVEWKRSLLSDGGGGGGDGVGTMAFLHFVVGFGLLSELTLNEILTFSATAAANDDLPQLYRSAGLTDKVPALVQKLLDRCKHILAVKYVIEFNLADKIPLVPILEAHVNESQKRAKRLSEEGKSLGETTAREIHALKSAIKVIKSHNLQSEYPPESLEQRIEQLMKHKENAALAFAAKPSQHQQKQSGIKRPRMSAPVGSASVLNSVSGATLTGYHYQQPHFQSSGILPDHQPHFQPSGLLPEHQPHFQSSGLLPEQQSHFQSSGLLPEQQPQFQSSGLLPEQQPHFQSSGLMPEHQPRFQSSGLLLEQQSHFQSSGLLPEHQNSYTSLPTMSYGMKAATPTISPYTGASTGSYGLDGVPMGPSGNLGQRGSLPNSSEPLMPSGYYDSVSAYGGYGLQHYYQTPYPQ